MQLLRRRFSYSEKRARSSSQRPFVSAWKGEWWRLECRRKNGKMARSQPRESGRPPTEDRRSYASVSLQRNSFQEPEARRAQQCTTAKVEVGERQPFDKKRAVAFFAQADYQQSRQGKITQNPRQK